MKVQNEKSTIADFDTLPDSARIRPGSVMKLLSISAPTLYRQVKEGKLPKPGKIGNTASWSVGQIRRVLASLGQ